MKRTISILLSVLLMTGFLMPSVSAKETPFNRSIEYLDNGDYIIYELISPAIQPRTGTTGTRRATYYTGSGSSVFTIQVTGNFTYSYGVSSSATSSTASLYIYDSNAEYSDKYSYTFGSTAYAYGAVSYYYSKASQTVSVSCDKYGNIY